MIKNLSDYKSIGIFAKEYVGKNGKKGVSKKYIYDLIKQEIQQPGSSGLDVLHYPDVYLVKYSPIT